MSYSVSDALKRLRAQGALSNPPPVAAPKNTPVPAGIGSDNGSLSSADRPLPDLSGFTKPDNLPASSDDTQHDSHLSPFKLKTPPRRTTVVDPNTPDQHIPTPDRNTAKFRSPHPYHTSATLEKPPNKEIRKLEKNLSKKERHTVIVTESPLKKDVPAIKSGRLTPNEHGVIRVPTSTGDERVWVMHSNNNGDGTNRLIPVKGPGFVPFLGSQLKTELDDFRTSAAPSPTLADHIDRHVQVVPNPKKRKETSPASPTSDSDHSSSSATQSPLVSLSSPGVLSPSEADDGDSDSAVTPGKLLILDKAKQRKLNETDSSSSHEVANGNGDTTL